MQIANPKEKEMIKNVVIVDDQNLFAEGFSRILEGIPGVKVQFIIRDGEQVNELLHIFKPDILFLDLNLPKKNGLDILKSIRPEFPKMIIAILTVYEDQLLISRVRKFGANAYLSKDASVKELKTLISLKPGEPFYVNCCLSDKGKTDGHEIFNDTFKNIGLLTTREKEIISLIVEGKNMDQISKELFISFNTLKTHKKNIFSKLSINKVSELVKFAYENKLA